MSDHSSLRKNPVSNDRWILAGVGYTILVALIAGVVNYTLPYSPEPVDSPTFLHWWLWSLLYIPLLVFPFLAKWEVKDFGFSINPLLLAVSLLIALFCGLSTLSAFETSWLGGLAEAYARTGEELFFRGFLFLLLQKIFHQKRRPWIWATVISSLIFTIIHTQTFQPNYFSEDRIGHPAYFIFERLFNLFLIGFGLALLRYWTKSVLPGSIIHSQLQGGWITLPYVILIYAVIVIWGIARKEKVISGFSTKHKAV